MEAKYYTPQIEEFRVGFEYEEMNIVSVFDEHWKVNVRKSVFTQELWATGYANWDFLDKLKEGKIRVKYLDKEDIESLDFVFEEQEVGRLTFTFKKHGFIELHILQGKLSLLNNGRTIFEGKIKNKSELKKVLQMLDIK